MTREPMRPKSHFSSFDLINKISLFDVQTGDRFSLLLLFTLFKAQRYAFY
jgi:hypothetical protein